MEGWRQRRLGSKEDHSTTKSNYKTDLTLTGLLMEGLGRACCVGGQVRDPAVHRTISHSATRRQSSVQPPAIKYILTVK